MSYRELADLGRLYAKQSTKTREQLSQEIEKLKNATKQFGEDLTASVSMGIGTLDWNGSSLLVDNDEGVSWAGEEQLVLDTIPALVAVLLENARAMVR